MAGKKSSKERGVLITTAHRGVFFGYTSAAGPDIIKAKSVSLKLARNCLYWSADVKGFEGLAVTGPSASCRIGPAADLSLAEVTCVAEATPEAVKAWEAAPWRG